MKYLFSHRLVIFICYLVKPTDATHASDVTQILFILLKGGNAYRDADPLTLLSKMICPSTLSSPNPQNDLNCRRLSSFLVFHQCSWCRSLLISKSVLPFVFNIGLHGFSYKQVIVNEQIPKDISPIIGRRPFLPLKHAVPLAVCQRLLVLLELAFPNISWLTPPVPRF